MKPYRRKQLPPQIYNLLLCEADQDNAIQVYVGDCKQTFTPFFNEQNQLVAVFYSWQAKFIHTRIRHSNDKWPIDRLFINVPKLLSHWKGKVKEICNDIILQNKSRSEYIDPNRDARMFWDKPSFMGSPECSNIDIWAKYTNERLDALKNNTAKTFPDPHCHMAMLGVSIAVVSCLDSRADSPNYLHEFDEIIGQEADAYLKSNLNYAYNYKVVFKSDIVSYPYLDHLHETMAVEVPVPELLGPLLKTKHKIPLWKGITYVGLKKFKQVARILFIAQWKDFALKVLASFPSSDSCSPSALAFREFSNIVKIRPNINLDSSPLLQTSANSLFPVMSPAAPPCMHKLFEKKHLKHYERWQLGELAVDMGWSINNLMTYYTDTPANRKEVVANYHSYRKKTPPRNRCKIFKKKGLCAYDHDTFHLCASVGGSAIAITDIEDLNPAHFFQRRLQNM